jgi:DNA mismatch repair protein MutS2
LKRELKVLEFEKIRGKLLERVASKLTENIINELMPQSILTLVEERLTETSEAVSVIMRKGSVPLGDFPDIKPSVIYANKGGALSMSQLLSIAYHLGLASKVKSFLSSDLAKDELKIISGMVSVLETDRNLKDRIDISIISDTEMSDSASSELKKIRRSMALQNEAIKNKMNQIVSSSSNRTKLQDQIVTMRDGRYVIPVKQEHRQSFPGIVHDQSKGGATLFVEPQAIVNLNNELRELELAEEREIERILAELSAQVSTSSHLLINNQELLIQIDFIFAKGKLSVDMGGNRAKINEDSLLIIRSGRHPLLDPDKVVPVSLELGRGYRTLIITGPNTGGKTVTLKTVGLFVLMTMAGLHIPAEAGTEIPIVKDVFADIGDEQSIEQSLSTFSSHMKNIVNIVNEADNDTLVLLDELGAGTDPTEGAALAMSILERLRQSGSLNMATTHYTELKKYALGTVNVENASMEFNIETLSPTYKLTVGIPGRSNAFEISRKLDLPEDIIDRAQGYLDGSDVEFEAVLETIERDKQLAEEERDEALFLKLELKRQKEELDKAYSKLDEKKEQILKKAKDEAREIVSDAKESVQSIKEELKELADVPDRGDRLRRFDERNKALGKVEGKYRESLKEVDNPNPLKSNEIRIGDRVKLINLDQNGEVLTLADDRGEVGVLVGRIKMTTPIENLRLINDGKKKKSFNKSAQYGNIVRTKIGSIRPEIDVRGENLDGASIIVNKYLDDAYMSGLKQVTVIHGRGEGILREGLTQMMKKNRYVKNTRKGAYNQGGDGVTIVEFKE